MHHLVQVRTAVTHPKFAYVCINLGSWSAGNPSPKMAERFRLRVYNKLLTSNSGAVFNKQRFLGTCPLQFPPVEPRNIPSVPSPQLMKRTHEAENAGIGSNGSPLCCGTREAKHWNEKSLGYFYLHDGFHVYTYTQTIANQCYTDVGTASWMGLQLKWRTYLCHH